MDDTFTLDDCVLHLDGVGPIGRAANDQAFWARTDASEFTTGHVLSVFSYGTTWDYQERHPDGDELAFVLEGDIDFLLDTGAGERAVHVPRASGCLVPAGTWHRVAVHEPSTILFITPVPARTEHRRVRSRHASS